MNLQLNCSMTHDLAVDVQTHLFDCLDTLRVCRVALMNGMWFDNEDRDSVAALLGNEITRLKTANRIILGTINPPEIVATE